MFAAQSAMLARKAREARLLIDPGCCVRHVKKRHPGAEHGLLQDIHFTVGVKSDYYPYEFQFFSTSRDLASTGDC